MISIQQVNINALEETGIVFNLRMLEALLALEIGR